MELPTSSEGYENHLLAAFCDALEADGEAVAAEDGEDDAYCAAASACLDILCDVIHGGVIAFRPGYDGLGNGHDITVAEFKSFIAGGAQ